MTTAHPARVQGEGVRLARRWRWRAWADDGIQASGELRHQFDHVIDVAPTLLEAAGLPQPTFVHGIQQRPIEGVSMAYSFEDADAPERHQTQYFEMFGNRGIYHKGWSAITKHRTPWQTTGEVGIAFDDDTWELYDGASDWTQARDLAAEHPDKPRELQRLFLIEATQYNVLPLDDRGFERATPETAGRPALIQGTSQVLFDGMGGLNENCVVNVRNKSHSVTAELVVPDEGANGVLINQGGIAAGWALYVKDGRLPRTVPIGFSADETTDVGRDTGSPVSDDYPATDNDFTGTINWVRIDLGDDSHDHQIDPAHLLHLAMARQ